MRLPKLPRSADIYGLLYTPAERRRLARSGSGLGRRSPRRVSRARPFPHQGFTRAAVEGVAVLAAPRVGPRDIEIREIGVGHVVVVVPAHAVRDVAARLGEIRPAWMRLEVISA